MYIALFFMYCGFYYSVLYYIEFYYCYYYSFMCIENCYNIYGIILNFISIIIIHLCVYKIVIMYMGLI